MGRKSTGLNVKLLRAGAALARERGLAGFGVRELCAKAKVNLGMFHYHFGSKENFDKALLKEIYSSLSGSISIAVNTEDAPRENVRRILLEILSFVKQHSVLLSVLMGDVLSGNKKIMQFIAANFTMHLQLMHGELERARKAGDTVDIDAPGLMVMLVAHIVVPNIVQGTLKRFGGAGDQAGRFVKTAQRSELKRIDFMLDAVFKKGK